MPLKFRRKLLLGKYAARVSTHPHHPVRQLLLRKQLLVRNPKNQALPFSVRVGELMSQMELSIHNIAIINVPETINNTENSVSSTLSQFNKNSLSNALWGQMFADLLMSYRGAYKVYCDGSVRRNTAGFGIWSEEFTLRGRLPDGSSILHAELMAIYSALLYLSRKNDEHRNALILTDSLSSVQCIRNPMNSRSSLPIKINSLLNAFTDRKVAIEWIPSHVDIAGNTEADELARTACDLQHITTTNYELHDLYGRIEKFCQSLWQKKWTSSGDSHQLLKPTVGDSVTVNMSRHRQIIATRLRLGTCRFTHSYLYSKTPKPQCYQCQEPITVKHILITCPLLRNQRSPLLQICEKQGIPFELMKLLAEDSTVMGDVVAFFEKIKTTAPI